MKRGKRRNADAGKGTPRSSDLRKGLWRAIGGALIGATVVCGVLMAFTFRWLAFDDLPRTSALVVVIGIIALMYAQSRLVAAIALLADQTSVRTKQAAVAAQPDKRRSG